MADAAPREIEQEREYQRQRRRDRQQCDRPQTRTAQKREQHLADAPGTIVQQPDETVSADIERRAGVGWWQPAQHQCGVHKIDQHATGDAVLVAVAQRLRATVRSVDFACRLGGDEFVVLLPDITDDEAVSIARRIISRISEPFEFAPAARIVVSIGIAAAAREGGTADELLSAADRAMYKAKRHGKGGSVIHAPSVEIVSLAPSVEAHSAIAAECDPQ